MKQFIICPNCRSIELTKLDFTHDCSVCNYMSDHREWKLARAISIKQPWAYLIASGIKDIENRTWKTNFRGRVLIHAGSKRVTHPFPYSLFTVPQSNSIKNFRILEEKEKTTSAIIGSVEIVDCIQDSESIWAEYWAEDKMGREKAIWNWVLANPILFEKPILGVKGKLSFFIPEIKEQLNQ